VTDRRKIILVAFLGLLTVSIVGFLVWFGIFRNQRINFSFASTPTGNFHLGCVATGKNGKMVTVNDSDSRIIYAKTWGSSTSGYPNGYHFAVKVHPQLADTYEGSTATLNFKGNKALVTTLNYNNRGFMEVWIDGKLVDTIDQYVPVNSGLHPATWTSPELSCGDHTLVIKQSEKSRVLNNAGRKTRLIVLDSLSYRECQVAPGKACGYVPGKGSNTDGCTKVGANCTNLAPPPEVTETHLECINEACAKVNGLGSNLGGCTVENAACGINSPNPNVQTTFIICQNNTCATSTTALVNDPACNQKQIGDGCGVSGAELKCQGNTDAPARCFDCKRDNSASSSTSEINILDFSCFAKYYGKEVGKN
jgi:hypothetical protein